MTFAQARRRTDDEWRQRLAADADSVTLVEDGPNGRLIGMASGFYAPDTRVAEVGGMFVDPAHRRAGVGKHLLEAVEAWARGLGATRIELEVNPELEAALRLYERCGYTRSGSTRALPSQPSATAVRMSKTLRLSG
jgi:GNAT superfamily N-acetyltransferase